MTWKRFWAIVTFFVIILAILSRQRLKVNLGEALAPAHPPLPPKMPTPPLQSHNGLKLEAGPETDRSSVLYKWSAQKCERALTRLMNEKGFWAHRKPMNKRQIPVMLISPKQAFGEASIGSYSPSKHAISIVMKPNLSEEKCLKALRNEYFSYQVQNQNEFMRVNFNGYFSPSLPFLNSEGNINAGRYEQFKDAVIAGKSRVEKLFKIFHQLSPATAAAKELLAKLRGVVKNYEPSTYYLDAKTLSTALQYQVAQRDAKGQVRSGANHPAQLPKSYGQVQDDGSCTYQHGPLEHTTESNLEALLGDLSQSITSLSSTDGPYSKTPEYHRWTELGSFFADFSPEIGECLFPEFYGYMKDFFAEKPAQGLRK